MTSQEPYGTKGERPFRRWWKSRTFWQKRFLRANFGILVMVIWILLYYLGLFGGSVEGPLEPGRLGEKLRGMGVTVIKSQVFFLSFVIIGISWNWVYNLVSFATGSRLTCNRKIDEQGAVCGARVKRNKVQHKKTGEMVAQFVCADGHRRPQADFHPIKKGRFSHTLWIIALACLLITVFH